jgi:transposase
VDAELARESESRVSKRNRRKFEPEFKTEAVRLVLEEGRTINAVAKSLGIYSSSLSDWVRQAEIDRGKGPPGALKTEELEELRRLRKENRELKVEREILKKAAAFFAKESS